jgi:hypothetical protein
VPSSSVEQPFLLTVNFDSGPLAGPMRAESTIRVATDR